MPHKNPSIDMLLGDSAGACPWPAPASSEEMLVLRAAAVQVHLSHNRITNIGAAALLRRIPTPPLTHASAGRQARSRQSLQQPQVPAGQPMLGGPVTSSLDSSGSNGPTVETDIAGTPSKPSPPVSAHDPFTPTAPSPAVSAAEQLTRLLTSAPASQQKPSGSTASSGTLADSQLTFVGTATPAADAAALEDTASSPNLTQQAAQARQLHPSPNMRDDPGQPAMAAGAKTARKPLWLRLEWNQIGLTEFMQVSFCR